MNPSALRPDRIAPPVLRKVHPNMKSLRVPLMAAMLTISAFAARRPNIVVILADDMGYSDVGCYGGEIATPNLDSLAAGGLRFTQMYNTARCWSSRASIMTGYYAQEVRRDIVEGVVSGTKGKRPGWAALLSEYLRPLGYRNYHSGKWHIDGKPLTSGFDHSFDVNNNTNDNFSANRHTYDEKQIPQTKGYYVTTEIATRAIDQLREHEKEHSEQPFFLYLCFIAPHFPLQAPAADIARYRDRYRVGWNVIAAERYARLVRMGLANNPDPMMERDVGPPYDFPADVAKIGPGEINRPLPWSELTDVQRDFQATKMSIHAAMVDRMDQEIGRVLAQIKAMGDEDNTIVMFASDNGASAEMMVRGGGHDPSAAPGSERTFLCLGPGWSSSSNTPFRRHKTWVHEGGISTPFIVRWPAGIRARGELRTAPLHFIDVVPSLLEVAGGAKPESWKGLPVPPSPGRSFVKLFDRDGPGLHENLWWEHEGNRALREGDWKIVAVRNGPWELYNLANDRSESHNLAAAEPDRVRSMAAQWERKLAEIRVHALTDYHP